MPIDQTSQIFFAMVYCRICRKNRKNILPKMSVNMCVGTSKTFLTKFLKLYETPRNRIKILTPLTLHTFLICDFTMVNHSKKFFLAVLRFSQKMACLLQIMPEFCQKYVCQVYGNKIESGFLPQPMQFHLPTRICIKIG